MTKKKTKGLLPSLRERKRYLAFKIVSKEQIKDFKVVSRLIKANCLKFLGELRLSEAGIMPLEDKFKDNKGIIRVNNKYLDELRATLPLIQEGNMIFMSLGASGILKKVENKYLRGA